MAVLSTITDEQFYPIWKLTFNGQLKKLYETTTVVDEGQEYHFHEMHFDDFCLMIFEERSDLIDDQQN